MKIKNESNISLTHPDKNILISDINKNSSIKRKDNKIDIENSFSNLN